MGKRGLTVVQILFFFFFLIKTFVKTYFSFFNKFIIGFRLDLLFSIFMASLTSFITSLDTYILLREIYLKFHRYF